MLGFKIFDGDAPDVTQQLIELALKDQLALECAFYNDNAHDFISRMRSNLPFLQNPHKSVHLNYKKAVGNNIHIPKYYANLLEEMQLAEQLGIHQGVLHFQHGHYEIHIPSLQPQPLRNNLTLLHQIANAHQFTFYIENTLIHRRLDPMNNLAQHRIIWDTILELGFEQRLGFCLDWGHVKAFSTDALAPWLEYSDYLRSKGMPIYMHVHDNNAQKDQHCTLFEGFEQQLHVLNHPIDPPYFDQIAKTQSEFASSILILENSTEYALDHYLWLKQRHGASLLDSHQ